MFWTKFKLAAAVLLAVGILGAGAGGFALHTSAAAADDQAAAKSSDKASSEAPNADVPKVLEKYRSARPGNKDLAIYTLDWVPTLKDAKKRAAKEKRPVLLLVVTNSYGDVHSGHC
jgi:hypothetical protein